MFAVILRIGFQHLCVYYHLIAFKFSYNLMAESVERYNRTGASIARVGFNGRDLC